MGTNFYLKVKIPIEYYPIYHIGKRSFGWKPSFEYRPEIRYDYFVDTENYSDDCLEIESVKDIKAYYDTGNYEIIDEYGEVYSWEDFEKEFLNHCQQGKSHFDTMLTVTQDSEGYEFIHANYS